MSSFNLDLTIQNFWGKLKKNCPYGCAILFWCALFALLSVHISLVGQGLPLCVEASE
jgi:hypothetical protein